MLTSTATLPSSSAKGLPVLPSSAEDHGKIGVSAKPCVHEEKSIARVSPHASVGVFVSASVPFSTHSAVMVSRPGGLNFRATLPALGTATVSPAGIGSFDFPSPVCTHHWLALAVPAVSVEATAAPAATLAMNLIASVLS